MNRRTWLCLLAAGALASCGQPPSPAPQRVEPPAGVTTTTTRRHDDRCRSGADRHDTAAETTCETAPHHDNDDQTAATTAPTTAEAPGPLGASGRPAHVHRGAHRQTVPRNRART